MNQCCSLCDLKWKQPDTATGFYGCSNPYCVCHRTISTPRPDNSSYQPKDIKLCSVCFKPMPKSEEMFNFHGYSGSCPTDPSPKKDYSHSHCWDQEKSACGIPLENHKQCCLCPATRGTDLHPNPKCPMRDVDEEKVLLPEKQPGCECGPKGEPMKWESEFDKNWESSWGGGELIKQIKVFINNLLTSARKEELEWVLGKMDNDSCESECGYQDAISIIVEHRLKKLSHA